MIDKWHDLVPVPDLGVYLRALRVGDRVVETSLSATVGAIGVVYISRNKGPSYGSKCVMWDLKDGKMGTSVIGGTRLVTDVLRQLNKLTDEAKK